MNSEETRTTAGQTGNKGIPFIIGHRGAAGEAPENTLASFELALEQGCAGIELDIHMSQDGQIMVCHDPTVDRTTTGTGAIRDLPAAQLRDFDAGVWFTHQYEGQRIPFLREVFELVPPEILINIEIKSALPELTELLVRMLDEYQRREQVIVSSFDHTVLKRLKALAPDIRIGLLFETGRDFRQTPFSLSEDVYSLHPHHRSLGAEAAAFALRNGKELYPYTVNEEKDMRRLAKEGVTGIITNYPARLKKVLDSL